MKISIEKAVTAKNDELAGQLRQRFAQHNIYCLNIIAAPGAGKTSLIEKTVEGLKDELGILVIEGDPHTCLDSDRIAILGAKSKQINTLGGCHLDAHIVADALQDQDLGQVDLLIFENIGNLLCPAAWDLGEDARLVVTSLPEGNDKPLKYPETFSLSHIMVINKLDLEPYLPTQAKHIRRSALSVNPNLEIFELSCLKGSGVETWLTWVRNQCRSKKGT